MKIKVKLFGTLSLHMPDYKPSQGIDVELPDGATVRDLFEHLQISEKRGVVAIVDGLVLKASDKVQDGASVNIFQRTQGG